VNATNLERNLNLTLQLIQLRKPMLIVLNMFDETKQKGIDIDVAKLEQILDLPVVPTCALTGEGIKELVTRMNEARVSQYRFEDAQRWNEIGKIIGQVQVIHPQYRSYMEKLQNASVRPVTGIPILLVVLFLVFTLIRVIGEGLIQYLFDPFFDNYWKPLMTSFSEMLSSHSLLHDLLIGDLMDGEIDFGQSFGLLTTGLHVTFGAVLPYVVAFYTLLSILEDTGYLPRVAVMVDNLMHKVGLHGLSIVPMLLGFGCNVPGTMATRILESRKEKFIVATLITITVPCMAMQANAVRFIGTLRCERDRDCLSHLVHRLAGIGHALEKNGCRWIAGAVHGDSPLPATLLGRIDKKDMDEGTVVPSGGCSYCIAGSTSLSPALLTGLMQWIE